LRRTALSVAGILALVLLTYMPYQKSGKVFGTSVSTSGTKDAVPAGTTTQTNGNQNSLDAVWTELNALQAQSDSMASDIQSLKTAPTPPKTYKYLLLENVWPCQINQLASDGWQLYQQGDFISVTPMSDPKCNFDKTQSLPQNQRSGLSWAIFQKESP
jgi:hypothetical protein